MTWAVYESATETGTFTQIYAGANTLGSSSHVWHSSPNVSIPVQAGMYYVFGAYWSSAPTTYNYGTSIASSHIATTWGEHVDGAYLNSASTLPTSTAFAAPNNTFPVRVHTGIDDDCGGQVAPSGNTLSLSGSIDATDPVWARPSQSCSSTPGIDHYYDVFAITNHTGADQTVDILAAWGGDGYLHVYDHPVDPTSVAGCLSGDDDDPTTATSGIYAEPIAAGQTLHIIASTFSANLAIGAYTIEISTN